MFYIISYCFNVVYNLTYSKIKVKNKDGEESEREHEDIVRVSKESFLNLKHKAERCATQTW